MMDKTILALEWKRFIRRPAARLALLAWPALLIFAAWNGHRFHAQQAGQQAIVAEKAASFYTEKAALLDSLDRGLTVESDLPWFQNPSNPLVVGAFRQSGAYVLKPQAPMAWLAIGQSDIYPDHYRASMLVLSADSSFSLENPYHQAVGRFDPLFLLVFLLPLLVIILGYDLLSADREGGTLPLLQAYAGGAQRLLGVRVLLLWLFVSLLSLLPLLGFGLAVASVSVGAMAVLALTVGAYSLFWVGLAAWANTAKRASVLNGLLLTGAWALLLFLLPAAVNAIINSVYPVPSRMAQVAAERSVDVEAERVKPQLLDDWYAQHPEVERLPEDQWGWADYWRHNFILNEYKDSMLQSVRGPFEQRLDDRIALLGKLQYLSPGLVANESLQRLAVVGQADFLGFKAGAEAFQAEWKGYFSAFFWEGRRVALHDLQARPEPQPSKDTGLPLSLAIAVLLWGVLPLGLAVRPGRAVGQ